MGHVVICSCERSGTYATWLIVRELQRSRGDWIEYQTPVQWPKDYSSLPDMDEQARFGALPTGAVVEVDGQGPGERTTWQSLADVASCWWTHSPPAWVLGATPSDVTMLYLHRELVSWAESFSRYADYEAPVARWRMFAGQREVVSDTAGAHEMLFEVLGRSLERYANDVCQAIYGDSPNAAEMEAIVEVASLEAVRARAPKHITTEPAPRG